MCGVKMLDRTEGLELHRPGSHNNGIQGRLGLERTHNAVFEVWGMCEEMCLFERSAERMLLVCGRWSVQTGVLTAYTCARSGCMGKNLCIPYIQRHVRAHMCIPNVHTHTRAR